ncbi:MAG: response regulator [Planctomycetaceae bacterium]|jgi:two-component system sensor histidine kinase/response regulator|nr:response regulator [Planctomycetaceae bacterium]
MFTDFPAVLNSAPFGVVLINEDYRLIDCNEAVLSHFGLAKQEFLDTFYDMFPPAESHGSSARDFVIEKIQTAFQEGRCVFEQTLCKQPPQQQTQQNSDDEPPLSELLPCELLPCEISFVRIHHEGVCTVAGYISDLRQVKNLLLDRDREQVRLQNILNSSPVCFAVLSGDTIEYAAPFMRNFLGVNNGESFQSFFVDTKTANYLLDQSGALVSPESGHQEAEIVRWIPVTVRDKSGDVKEMLANLFVIDDPVAPETIVWLLDVTQIRKNESALRLAREIAETAAKTKSDFLANMSHEIRTPMNAILGMLHLILRGELTPKQITYAETAEQSAKLLLRIINDILDFSKIEAGRMTMEYREFSVSQLVGDLRANIQESCQRKNLTLNVDLDPALPAVLMGDALRLRQVILNFLSNAVKFTEHGRVTLKMEVSERDALSALIYCSVSDTGIGMTPKQMSYLFKPFSQADTSTTRLYGGTGLGLVIAKQIVELMQGKISCKSTLGQGTTFEFTVRFGIPLAEEMVTEEEIDENRVNGLLAGDDKESLGAARNVLELLGSQTVAECTTPDDFQQFLDSEKLNDVDFILCSFTHWQRDIIPVYDMLRKSRIEVLPQLVFVNHPGIEPLLQQLQPAADVHLIAKPIIASELFNLLVTITAGKKAARKQAQQKRLSENRQEADGKSRTGIPDSIRGARILLAEDNKINQMVATELLKLEGFAVTVAGNGKLAVEAVNKEPFDLVLMDIQMPEMDGLAAARLIREDARFKNLPILAMTAHAMEGDRELSLEAGMNGHITKPINPEVLYASLVHWIKK